MAQLSLYIDEETLRRVETAARLENVSVSKYVVRKLNESMSVSWPQNYEKLFGSVQDTSFAAERPKDFENDAPRERM